ncbi:WD repeat-containing protein 11-like isoform X2 [Bolinopsis microptera]|uniref:WD repeat-containing protein 11-like isoform X2 n=1 Tax=Bolinopsis microptera TaxID=2820187 RepID=UPI003079BEF2
MRLSPRSIPGPLSAQNTGALDWGPQGLIAYGSHNSVAVVHVESLQLLQVLAAHNFNVSTVKWCGHNPYHNLLVPVSLLLASGDKSGRVIVWEALSGRKVNELIEATRTSGNVTMSWVPNTFFLIVLLPPHNVVLWNAASGTRIWKQTFVDPMYSFSLDPFDESRLVLVSDNSLIFVNDLDLCKTPNSHPKKYQLALGNKGRSDSLQPSITGDYHPHSNSMQGLIKVVHSPYCRNKLLLLYPRQITIIDLELMHATGYILQDRGSSQFIDMYVCTSDNIIYCLHDSGAISIRRFSDNETYKQESCYQCLVVSEAMRLCKNAKLIGLQAKPFTEEKLLFMLTDGRIVGWRLFDCDGPVDFLSEVQWEEEVRLVMIHNTGSNSSPPYSAKVCPPLSTKNSHFYRPLLALGSHSGSILIVDLTTTKTIKEFTLHTSPVCGIEWVANRRIISYSNNIGGSGPIKNELYYTDINTGRYQLLRTTTKDRDDVPIVGIKVSYLHQYFIVLLKDRPFELWDLKSLNIIREMPGNFPPVTTLEWSPTQNHSLKHAKFSKKGEEPAGIIEQVTNPTDGPIREHFVFTDTDGVVYHLMVEGTVIKEGTRIPPDSQTGLINSIAWRGDLMVLGDSTGHLSFWDLKARQSRLVPTSRGAIKKLLLAPGRNTQLLLVLFNDGVEIWDCAESEVLSSIKSSKIGEVVDVDWGASDRPIIVNDSGAVHIMDVNLDTAPNPVTALSLHTPIWLPFIYNQKEMMNFKIYIQHMGWQENWDMKCPASCTPIIWDSMLHTLKLRDKFSTLSFLERCLVTAALYGDMVEWRLWQVLAYYLDQSSPLSSAFDIVQDNQSYLKDQTKSLAVQEKCRSTYSHRQHSIHRHILLGNTDKPVQLLLEVEQDSPNFYQDCLRASLISSVSDSEVAQSTIKLVATNLIANDHLLEGCQLLCLIKKAVDACRYMQNFHHYNEAIWLAKVALSRDEYFEVMKYYIDLLVNNGSRHLGILLAISLHYFDKAAEILLATKLVTIAAPLVESCIEAGKWPDTGSDIKDRVFVEYAKYMVSLNNVELALKYCDMGGEKGKQLGEELRICAQ